MLKKQILLGLDGSAQSRYAAELSWSMAKRSGSTVIGQHVVDSLAAWDFLGFDIAGFIGSGPYFAAHETMRNSLYSIGESLVEAYKSLADDNDIEGEVHLDEGTTIREICQRAKDVDIVMLGHRSTGMRGPDEDRRRLPRRSVAESLTHYCPRPLLVVQDRCKPWSHMRIMLGSNQVPSELLSSCLELAKTFKIEPSVRYMLERESGPGDQGEVAAPEAQKVLSDYGKLVPELTKVKSEVQATRDLNEYWKTEAEADPDTLVVVPVMELSGVRKTSFGTAPDLLVRYMNHASILFWIQEEHVEEKEAAAASQAAAATS